MANQKAQQIGIPFEAPINMNKNQTDIKQFVGYNDRNSPVYGGNLSPLYFKTVANTKKTIFDKDGNYYQLDSGTTTKLIKNGTTTLMTVNSSGYSKEEIHNISTISSITVDPIDCDYFMFDIYGNLYYITISNINIVGTVAHQIATLHAQVGGVEYTYTYDANESMLLGTRIYEYMNGTTPIGYVTFLIAGKLYDNYQTFSVGAVTFSTSTKTFTPMAYGDSTGGYVICRPGATMQSNGIYDVVGHWQNYPINNIRITTDIKVTYNVGKPINGFYPITVCLSKGDGSFAGTDSNFSFVNLAINYSEMRIYDGIFNGPDYKTSITYDYRQPNAVIDGTNQSIYMGYQSTYYDATPVKIYPFGTITSIAVNATTASSVDITSENNTTAEYNYFTVSDHRSIYDTTDRPCYFNYGGRTRVCNSDTFTYIYDTTLGLRSTAVSINSSGNFTNNTGMAIPLGNVFGTYGYVLLNNNNIQGVSSASHVLLSDWAGVSGDNLITFNSNASPIIYYADSNRNVYYKVSVVNSVSFKIVENRYIVMNTTSAANCYDIQTGDIKYYATDWNNRYYVLGGSSQSYGSYYTAQNADYVRTNDAICSVQFPINVAYGVSKAQGVFDAPIDGLLLELYIANNTKESLASNATYDSSMIYSKGAIFHSYDALHEGVAYEAAALNSSPSIFDTYITSFTNQDMILTNTRSYPLKYYNNTVILLYYMTSFLENVQNTFVIQGQSYAIVDNKIYKTEYSSGNLILSLVVVDVFGLQYVGASPYMALFYSPTNRTIYSFTGDAILNFVQDANTISEIYLTAYNPSTYKFYLCTNNGLYIVSGNSDIASSYRLNLNNIDSIWFTTQGPIVVTDSNIIYISYYSQTGYTDNKLTLSTCYYGAGNNYVGIIDCIYIRLYSENKANGTFTINLNTLTNEGCTNEVRTFNIKASDWDKLTNTFYIRYQPKNQRSVGTSINLTSDFPLASMTVSYSQDTTVQISNNNI